MSLRGTSSVVDGPQAAALNRYALWKGEIRQVETKTSSGDAVRLCVNELSFNWEGNPVAVEAEAAHAKAITKAAAAAESLSPEQAEAFEKLQRKHGNRRLSIGEQKKNEKELRKKNQDFGARMSFLVAQGVRLWRHLHESMENATECPPLHEVLAHPATQRVLLVSPWCSQTLAQHLQNPTNETRENFDLAKEVLRMVASWQAHGLAPCHLDTDSLEVMSSSDTGIRIRPLSTLHAWPVDSLEDFDFAGGGGCSSTALPENADRFEGETEASVAVDSAKREWIAYMSDPSRLHLLPPEALVDCDSAVTPTGISSWQGGKLVALILGMITKEEFTEYNATTEGNLQGLHRSVRQWVKTESAARSKLGEAVLGLLDRDPFLRWTSSSALKHLGVEVPTTELSSITQKAVYGALPEECEATDALRHQILDAVTSVPETTDNEDQNQDLLCGYVTVASWWGKQEVDPQWDVVEEERPEEDQAAPEAKQEPSTSQSIWKPRRVGSAQRRLQALQGENAKFQYSPLRSTLAAMNCSPKAKNATPTPERKSAEAPALTVTLQEVQTVQVVLPDSIGDEQEEVLELSSESVEKLRGTSFLRLDLKTQEDQIAKKKVQVTATIVGQEHCQSSGLLQAGVGSRATLTLMIYHQGTESQQEGAYKVCLRLQAQA